MRLELAPRTLALAEPMIAAHGEVRERAVTIVTLTGADGVTGVGEAAPLPSYDGSDEAAVADALSAYADVLAGAEQEGLTGVQMVERCRALTDVPAALAAIEVALWDRAARREGVPLARLLTDEPAPFVPVNATLTATDRAGASEQADAAARAGYRCVKLKVGIGDDSGRVAAVRAATGPQVALRLDANGAWDVEQAVAAIGALEAAGLELVEEPTHGVNEMRSVREQVQARVAIDETAARPGALAPGVADAVCLKLGRCGGISGLLATAALARAYGAEVYVSSTLEGPIGVAAALHAASALASRGSVAPCGLATLGLFEGDLADLLPVVEGEIALPTGPGLGLGVEPF